MRRPLLNGCTTYRICIINWCIPSKNRQIYPLEGFTVSTHFLRCPAHPPPPPRALPYVQTHAPTSLKTPPSPHRLYDLQDTLDKLMLFLPQLSEFVPLKNGFYSFRAQTGQHHPVDPAGYTVVPRGVADLYPSCGHTARNTRDRGVSHTACKDEFRPTLRSHSWSVFLFS